MGVKNALRGVTVVVLVGMTLSVAPSAAAATATGPQAPAITAALPGVSAPLYSAPGPGYDEVCGPAEPDHVQCLALRRQGQAVPNSAVAPNWTPFGYGPADIASAYAIPAGSGGAGLTVAVVDAHDLPTAEADLAVYRAQYGLPPCTTANGCFRKVDQDGGTSYPSADAGWGREIALDIEMVSAACPSCKILLVEADDSSLFNIATAVHTAADLGAVAVSNSYGAQEASWMYSGPYAIEPQYNRSGVVMVASSGDCGYDCAIDAHGVEFPASSRYVVSVGGTSLSRAANARGWNETAWGGAGSGCSLYVTKPGWQTDPTCTKRMSTDVSAVANPSTGVAVYNSIDAGWAVYGGTSASSPIIAALFAVAGGSAASPSAASTVYGGSAYLNDVQGGNNDTYWGNCTIAYYCQGVAGYDGPTGLGTPNGIKAFNTMHASLPSAPVSPSGTRGDRSVSVSWSVPASDGGSSVTSYVVTSAPSSAGCTWSSGPLNCTVSGLTNGTAYTFTVAARNAVGLGPTATTGAVTPAALPSVPTGVTATAANLSAEVTWNASSGNGSAITSYTVTASDNTHTCTWTSGPLTCVVGSLLNGTPYTFTVTATSDIGTSAPSAASNSVTPAPVPDRPTAVTASAGHAAASVSWTAPADNGSTITAYTVTSTPSSAGCSTGGALTCTVNGLTNGQTYSFKVTAANGAGTSLLSTASNSVMPTDVPGAPAGVSASGGNQTATVSWSAAAANGSTISAYTVTANPGNHQCGWSSGPLSCTLTGLTNLQTYTVTVNAANGVGTGPDSSPAVSVTPMNGATYLTVTPSRVLDSRSGLGAHRFSSRVVQTVLVANGSSQVPSNAVAVTGNVTITGQSRAGYVTVAPSLTSWVQPPTSTINFPTGDTRANAVTVPLNAGKLDFMYWTNSSADTVQIIFDVTGYFAARADGSTYTTVTPARVLDSRSGLGGHRFSSRVAQTVLIANGSSGVPSNATAVTGNVTITGQSRAGYVTVAPSLTSWVQPPTSTINFPLKDTRANAVTAPLASGGYLDFMYWTSSASDSVQVIFDVTGYFSADPTGSTYHTVSPSRVLDSRSSYGGSRFSSRVAQSVLVANGASNVPTDATAVTGNVTITGQSRAGYVTVAPSLTSWVQPPTSTINFPTGDTRANAATVPLASGGRLGFMYWTGSASDTTQVIFDVTGYFAR